MVSYNRPIRKNFGRLRNAHMGRSKNTVNAQPSGHVDEIIHVRKSGHAQVEDAEPIKWTNYYSFRCKRMYPKNAVY